MADNTASLIKDNGLDNKSINIFSVLLLLVLGVMFSLSVVKINAVPFEDAAMLMRYAKNFAGGHGIVWNIGDKPVDGATDFLFMITIAALNKTGLSIETAVRVLGYISHLLTVILIFLCTRIVFRVHFFPAFFSSIYLLAGPGFHYVNAYFGTTYFALFASLSWLFTLLLINDKVNSKYSLCFSISSLITSLIRPEGVILTFLMIISIIYYHGLKKSLTVIYYYLSVFLMIGGFYFLWRWSYFGYPLPNPYYKKGGGHIYINSLMMSVRNVIILSLPFLFLFLPGLFSKNSRKLFLSYLITIAGFTCSFILLTNDMNYHLRFQYALLPMIIMSGNQLINIYLKDVIKLNFQKISYKCKIIFYTVFFIFALSGCFMIYALFPSKNFKDSRYDAAVMLAKYKNKNYMMAVTEAGLLPLYSDWKAIDTWGLNDQWIAHNGKITEEYLDKFKPELIVSHCSFSPAAPVKTEKLNDWEKMVLTLKEYAEKNNYILAGAFGINSYDTHYYYVKTGFADSDEIIGKIRNMDYYWFLNGNKTINYAKF